MSTKLINICDIALILWVVDLISDDTALVSFREVAFPSSVQGIRNFFSKRIKIVQSM